MLNLLNDYLQIGVDAPAPDAAGWPLTMAAVLVAALILKRQSND
jgi:hypothetical protein